MSAPLPSSSIETLLAEVEAVVADIMAHPALSAVDDSGVTAWALDCCREMREAVNKSDAAGAAYVGCRLGERLAELRRLGDMARRLASQSSPVDRAHERDVERRREYFSALNRGFSTAEACKKAAMKLGVSPKTIMRAVNGH
jgi:hypothetical protein